MQKRLKKKWQIKYKKHPLESVSFGKEKEQKKGEGFHFIVRPKQID